MNYNTLISQHFVIIIQLMFLSITRALMEAQDIFGLDFDFDEFEKYGRDDFSSDEEEDEYEEEEVEDGVLRRPKKKSTKKSIYEVSGPEAVRHSRCT